MTLPDMVDVQKENESIREFLRSVGDSATTDVADRVGNFRGMFYGNDGTGKTIAGLVLLNYIVPADKTIVLVDTSENWVSINNHPALKTKLSNGRPRFVCIKYGGERWLHALAATIRRKTAPFDNVGGVQFDEFSTMADTMLGVILKVVEDKNPSRPKDDATWPEYKMLLRKMKNVIQMFGNLEGVHCTFICHYRTDKDGRGMPVESPNFTPSVGPEIRKPMHLIAYLSLNEQGTREFQLQPDRGHLAKCKIGGLDRVVRFEELAPATRKWLNGEAATETKVTVHERVENVTDEETTIDLDDFDIQL